MDIALDGVHWWSLIILEGYSRTMLAAMMAPTEATWVALMVVYTACLRYGAPETLVSDGSGEYYRAVPLDLRLFILEVFARHACISYIDTQGIAMLEDIQAIPFRGGRTVEWWT
jgi:hypothetical protein